MTKDEDRRQFFYPTERKRRLSWLLITLAVLFTAFGSYSGRLVWTEIGKITLARNDVVPWNLAQLEVEYFGFARSLQLLGEQLGSANRQADAELASEAVIRFDVFYSRVTTISESPLYQSVRSSPESAEDFERLRQFVTETAPTIDALAQVDSATVADLAARTALIHSTVRDIALAGIRIHGQMAESNRQTIMATLGQYWVSMSGLILAQTLLALMLWTSARQLQRQSTAILATTAQLTAIFQASPYPILVVGGQREILEINRAAEKAFGLPANEARGKRLADFISHDVSNSDFAKINLHAELDPQEGDGAVQRQSLARRRDGTTFPAMSLHAKTVGPDGDVNIVVVRDVSETLRFESALLESRDTARAGERAKERLLAVISHEMRTPLHAILGSIELLAETQLTPSQRRLAGISEDSAKTLLNQVDNLLHVARDTARTLGLSKKAFDLRRLVDGILDTHAILATRNNNTLALVEFPADAQWVEGDPDRLRQVLVNLLANAIKFTADGKIALSVRRQRSEDTYEFEVSDTGIGISATEEERIFEDFYSTQRPAHQWLPGTGLGLGITRRIVGAMGGSLALDSEVGKGSRFTVSIPLAQAQQPRERVTSPTFDLRALAKGILDGNLRKILIAEDDAFSRNLLVDGLEELGFEVTAVENGQDAVQSSEAAAFDCILLDINMPKMSGVEAAAAIRAGHGASAEAPIFALTAHVFPEEMKKFDGIAIDKILSKPLSRKALLIELGGLADTLATRQDDELTSLVDQEQFNDLLDHYGSVDAIDLLGRFFDDCVNRLDLLKMPENDAESLNVFAREFHSLRGAAALFGAKRCAARLLDLETLARDGKCAEALAGVGAVRSILRQTTRALERQIIEQAGRQSA